MRKASGFLILLGLLGSGLTVMWFHRHSEADSRTRAVAMHGEMEEGEDDPDAPEFIMHLPHGRERTRWSALDDVGSNHRCNQDSLQQMQNETPCATSPVDPEVMIVGANDFRNDSANAGYYRTTDGGNTWQQSLFTRGPANRHCPYSGDPSICADALGRFHAIYLAYYCPSGSGVYSQTTTDNGTTWSAPVAVGTLDEVSDKVMCACDINVDGSQRERAGRLLPIYRWRGKLFGNDIHSQH